MRFLHHSNSNGNDDDRLTGTYVVRENGVRIGVRLSGVAEAVVCLVVLSWCSLSMARGEMVCDMVVDVVWTGFRVEMTACISGRRASCV